MGLLAFIFFMFLFTAYPSQAAYIEDPKAMVTFICSQDSQTMALLEGFTASGKEISWWLTMYNLRSQPIPYGTYSLRIKNKYSPDLDLEVEALIEDNKVITVEKYTFVETTLERVSLPIKVHAVIVDKPSVTVAITIPEDFKFICKVSTRYTQLDVKETKEER